ALIDAGDRAAARAVLERVGADPTAPPDAQALARVAVIEVMIEDGQLDAAAARLATDANRLPAEERTALRLALARARITQGELARADSALVGDSGLEATAMRGWIALYGGDLRGAAERFRAAGPYAGERGEATERSAMLALLQQIPRDRFPELGAALLLLARGDSAAAVEAVVGASDRLGGGGRADLRLLAGKIATRIGGTHEARAAALFADVVETGGMGAAAPAAELEWARLLVRQGRQSDAVAHLEHLILTYPTSAVVPEARRELERAKGAIPRS
ncbi:MAG: tetratricopeptide repeat protein, partial [Gemmatimonadales bacterium]